MFHRRYFGLPAATPWAEARGELGHRPLRAVYEVANPYQGELTQACSRQGRLPSVATRAGRVLGGCP
jgi:hypothetical protein